MPTPSTDPTRAAKRARWAAIARATPTLSPEQITEQVEREFAARDEREAQTFQSTGLGAMARGASEGNALRTALAERRALREAGTPAAAFAAEGTRVDQSRTGGRSVPRVDSAPALARLGLQGATMGFSDEIRGRASQLVGGNYEAARDAERAALSGLRRADGVMATAAEVAGGAATSVPGVGAAARAFGQTVRGRIAGGAAGGAIAGGLGGAGTSEAETVGGTTQDALLGALIGAGAGGATTGAAAGASRVLRAVDGDALGRTARRLVPDEVREAAARARAARERVAAGVSRRLDDAGLMVPAREALDETAARTPQRLAEPDAFAPRSTVGRAPARLADPTDIAPRSRLPEDGPAPAGLGMAPRRGMAADDAALIKLGRSLEADGVSLDELAARAPGMRRPEVLLDVGGENTRFLASAAQSTPDTPTAETMRRTLTARQRGQVGRLERTMMRAFGGSRQEDATTFLERINDELQTESAPAYQRAFFLEDGAPRVVDPRIFEAHIGKPTFRKALEKARQLAADEGIELPAAVVENVQGPNGRPVMQLVNPTLQQAHYTKMALDALAERGTPTEARSVGQIIKQFRSALYDAVPEYRDAQGIYAGLAEQREALAAGKQAWGLTPSQLQRTVSALSQDALAAYRIGALESKLSEIVQRSQQRDGVAKLATPLVRRQIQALVGDKAQATRIFRTFQREERMVQTRRGALEGSRTARLQQSMGELGDMPDVQPVQPTLTGIVMQAGRGMRDVVRSRNQSAIAEALGPRFLATPEQVPLVSQEIRDALARQRARAQAQATLGAQVGGQAARQLRQP